MANEGVFLNPSTGDVVATGVLSADAVNVPNISQYKVGQAQLVTSSITDETTKVPTSKSVKDYIASKIDQVWSWISGAELSVSQLSASAQQLSASLQNKVTLRDWS